MPVVEPVNSVVPSAPKASALKVRSAPAGTRPRVPLHWPPVFTSSAVSGDMSGAVTVTATRVTSLAARACCRLPTSCTEPVGTSG